MCEEGGCSRAGLTRVPGRGGRAELPSPERNSRGHCGGGWVERPLPYQFCLITDNEIDPTCLPRSGLQLMREGQEKPMHVGYRQFGYQGDRSGGGSGDPSLRPRCAGPAQD